MTPTSRAGRSSKQSGFTLIELSVVLIILAIALGMTLNLMGSSFLRDDFKKDVRQFQGLVNQVRQEAMLKKQFLSLNISLGSPGQAGSGYHVTPTRQVAPDSDPDNKPLFSDRVTILGIEKNGRVMTTAEQVSIAFTPQGLIEPFQLFVMAEDARYTLSVEAFSSRIGFEESEQFL